MPNDGFALYTIGKDLYKVANKDTKAFEKEFPNASVHYSTKDYNFDIPLSDRAAFLKDIPDARLSTDEDVDWNKSRRKEWAPSQYANLNYKQLEQEYEKKKDAYKPMMDEYNNRHLDLASPEDLEARAAATNWLKEHKGEYESAVKDLSDIGAEMSRRPEYMAKKEAILKGIEDTDKYIEAIKASGKDYNLGELQTAQLIDSETKKLAEQPYADPNVKRPVGLHSIWDYGKGALDKVATAEFLTRGLSNFFKGVNLRPVQKKLQEIQEEANKYKGTKEYDSKFGELADERLTDEDRILLRSYFNYGEMMTLRESNVPLEYRSGQMFADTMGYIADFMLTGGVAAAGERAAAKALGKWATKNLFEEGLKAGVVSLGGAAYRTLAMAPQTLGQIGQSLTEMEDVYDENGEVVGSKLKRNIVESVADGLIKEFIEVASEGSGELIQKSAQTLLARSLKRSALPKTIIGQQTREYIRGLGGLMRRGQFQGIGLEDVEEFLGGATNTALGYLTGGKIGDKDALKQVAESQEEMLLGFLPLTAVTTIGSLKAAARVDAHYEEGMNRWKGLVDAGAGVTDADLDAVVDGLENKSTEEVSKAVANIYDKIRQSGKSDMSEADVRDMMNWILEGRLAYDLQGELWVNSEERMAIANAYASSYGVPLEGNLYDINSAVQSAAATAMEQGFTEADLNKDASVLMQEAMELGSRGPANKAAAEALKNYAVAKASQQGINDGFQQTQKDAARQIEAQIEAVSSNGVVALSSLNGFPVIIRDDGTISIEGGKVSVNGNPDALVAITDEYGNPILDAQGKEVPAVKASQLGPVTAVDSLEHTLDLVNGVVEAMDAEYETAANTISANGMAGAIKALEGRTILVEGEGGEIMPVNIVKADPASYTAIISGKGGMQRIGTDQLYGMAVKEDDGSISLDPTAPENEVTEEVAETPVAQAPATPAAEVQATDEQALVDLIGTEVPITIGGTQVNAFVTEVEDGYVNFEYEVGGQTVTDALPYNQFLAAMQQEQAEQATAETETAETEEAPVEETPAAPQTALPMKNGEVDWDNMFNVDEQTFAARLPELVPLMQETYEDEAMAYAQSWYAAAKKKLEDAKKKTGDPKKDAANAKRRKEAQTLVANYSNLILAMSPRQQAPAAPAAPAEAETPAAEGEANVPDVSDDTPEAAQARGYIMENGNRIDRAPEDAVAAEGNDTQISFAKTQVEDAKYGLAEAERVIPSHIHDQENPLHFFARKWQPKDRKKKDSAVSIQQMANNIRPGEITRGDTAYNGAPIINARGEVIQGNGRSEALRRAYEMGKADAYKQWLADHASEFGLTAEQVNAMQNPVLVRVMNVDDAKAEQLGQRTQGDLESGGSATFNAKDLATKLGERLEEFMGILFGGDLAEDATLADVINANGQLALDWLHRNNIINDTEYQNATETTKSGDVRFTEAAVSAFRDLSLEPLFANAPEKVRQGFDKLPKNAKLALQRSVATLARLEGVIPDLQAALAYFYDFETADPAFKDAKTAEDASKAIAEWMQNLRMDTGNSEADLHPNIAARSFAAKFKGAKTIKGLVDLFQAIARAMQGETTLYGTTEAADRIDAYEQTGVLTEEQANQLRNQENDNTGGNDAGRGTDGQSGQRGSEGVAGSGQEVAAADEGNAGAAESGTGEVEGGEVAPEAAPVVEGELTEEEIRNSGYGDEDVIEAAIDFINGDNSFSNATAYQLVKQYVRSQRNTTEQAGGNADGAQLDGPVVQTAGVGAERVGGEVGSVGGLQAEGTAEWEPGSPNGSVSAGEGRPANAEGVGLPADVENTRGNGDRGSGVTGEPGRSNDVRGGQGQPASVAAQPAGGESAARPEDIRGSRRGSEVGGRGLSDTRGEVEGANGNAGEAGATAAGSTDISALGGELEDLLKQFGQTNYSVSREVGGLNTVSYAEAGPEEEGRLSRKQPKKPTAKLSLEGMTPEQALIAGKIIFTSAKLGYAYAKTEGLTTYNNFHRWFTQKFGDAVMKGLNYDESSLDSFIREVWDTKMKIDGKRITLGEHASDLRNTELQEEGKQSLAERAQRQKEANEKKIQVVPGSRKNIAETLPQLTPGQWDDVAAIERQFFDPSHNDYDHAYGKGMLITNGTGTGKTYTGLGTIKRFVDQGKGRILLVAPAVMTKEWVDKGNAMGIKMSQLANTKDKGKGVVVTSYENFRENRALYEDTFDLVVYDECQNIIENQKGEDTLAYDAHRKITNKNVEEATERLVANTVPGRRKYELEQEDRRLEKESDKKTTKESRREEITIRRNEIEVEMQALDSEIALLRPQFRDEAEAAVKKTKVLMLSATPFNTVKNLRYAEGYIYQYPKVFRSDKTEVTNEDARRNAFETEWFRGDEPTEQLEVAFGDHLLDDLETVSYRELENGFDHSRDFPDVKGYVMAARFNEAWRAIQSDPRFNALSQYAKFLTNPTWSSQLFETMKVSAIRDRLKEHLDAGRKIVIFHDRLHETKATDEMPPVGPPFAAVLEQAMKAPDSTPVMAITEFRRMFADVLAWEKTLDYRPVHTQIIDLYATPKDRAKYDAEMQEYRKKLDKWQQDCRDFEAAHPELTQEQLAEQLPKAPKQPQLEAESVTTFNGERTNAEKDRAKAAFNDDNSKVKIICVTTRSGGAGLSLHDTTGKHQRVLIQTALPVSPIGFIQAEGRIFRWGNRSNAIFEYPRLGLDLESWVFAVNFNAKAETVENLAHGFRGRGLKDSIMTSFWEHSGNVPIEGQGIGGVEMDKRGNTLKGMAKAKHDYDVVQRKGVKDGDQSIPEPVGFKMAEWAKVQSGDAALIPFAGRGSIARYIPKEASTTALETDTSLQADLMITSSGADFKWKEGTFADLNTINKADVVILNGNESGAADLNPNAALKKGFDHLSEGGRLIAIVPDTSEVNATLSKIALDGGVLRATIKVSNEALDRGEGKSRIVIIDKVTSASLRASAGEPMSIDLSNATREELFDLVDKVKVPERIIDKKFIALKKMRAIATDLRKNKFVESVDVDGDGPRPSVIISFGRRPTGGSSIKWRIDDLENGGWYHTGKWSYIRLSDFETISPDNRYIQRYLVAKDVVQMAEDDLRRWALLDSSATSETVENLRALIRLYMKVIRAGFGLSEAQIVRVAQGLRPEISAGDIETLTNYDELRAKFEASNNGDEERQELYDKVATVGEKLGLTIGAEAMDRDFAGGYNNVDNSLKVNKLRWNGLNDDKRASTLLHEFIHAVSVYSLAGYDTNASGMSDGLFNAAKLATDVYDQLTRGAAEDVRPFTGAYAIENAKELLAEMANNDIRAKLKNRRMWVLRDSRGIRVSGSEMEGAEQTTAWGLLNEALDGILKNFDKNLFDRFRGRASDYIWKVDPERNVYREADNDRGDAYRLFREDVGDRTVKNIIITPEDASYTTADEVKASLPSGGIVFTNGNDGEAIKVSKHSFRHSDIQNHNKADLYRAFSKIKEIVENAVNVGEVEKREGEPDSTVSVFAYYVPVNIHGRQYSARLVVKQLAQNERVLDDLSLYNVSLHKEKTSPTNVATEKTDGVIPGDVKSEYKVRELIHKSQEGDQKNVGITDTDALNFRERSGEDRRIAEIERLSTEATLDRMSEELGIKINRVSRDDMPKGHKTDKGYYDTATGEMTICMDNITDERDAIATVLHETVGHHGLRKLFGANFRDAMRDIYARLDEKGRTWVNSYIVNHGLDFGDEGIIRGMEEYLAHLAESGDFKNSVWDDIKEILSRIVDFIFGAEGFTFTDNELNYILRASYEHLKDPNWLNTVEGKAKDTLMKRALGINESDPNKPTDPQGPDAGRLYRDGDSGNARDDYEAALKEGENKMIFQHQNADLPVKLGMEKIMKEKGITSYNENEDYLTRHVLASSRAETQFKEFERKYFMPILDQMRAVRDKLLAKNGNMEQDNESRIEAYERTLDYLYAVSGLERTNFKNGEIEDLKQQAVVSAMAAADAKREEVRNSGKSQAEIDRAIEAIDKRLDAQVRKIESDYEKMKKDWSGLTSLTGESDWREAIKKTEQLIDDFKAEVGDDAMLDELWNRIRNATDYNLDHAYRYGLLTREEYERLHGTASQQRLWNYYLPLRGFSDKTAEQEYNYATLVHPSSNSVVVKKMNGRWTKADNPLANILNIAQTEIVQGNENWARQALYRFALKAGENSLLTPRDAWYVKDETTGEWTLAAPEDGESFEEFEAKMEKKRAGIKEDGTVGEPTAKMGRRGLKLDKIMANKAHRNEHLIRLKVGGMDKTIWVNGDPTLAKSVMGLERKMEWGVIRRASRVLSNLFTTYSLDFTARNLIRDTIYSRLALMVKEDNAYRQQFRKNWLRNFGYGAFAYPMVKLMAEYESGRLQDKPVKTKKEQMFLDFMADGGQTGYTIINSVDKIKKSIERSMARGADKTGKISIPILGHLAEGIKILNEGFELLTRFTAYETSRDMGRSGQRSALDAKEISVNFNRRGAQTGEGFWGVTAAYLGATHYFYNAGVQGFDNFLRLFKVNPKTMGVSTGALIALATVQPLLNSALAGLVAGLGGGGDDDWYWNLPEWVRRNNIIIGTGQYYLAIPLAVELRAFWGLGDIISTQMYHKEAVRNGFEVGADVINTAAEILPFNPVEGYAASKNLGEAIIRAAVPDAAIFLVDVATNRDYTGRPLWKENPFSNTIPKAQSAYASTPRALTEACKWLAEHTNGGVDIAPGLARDFLKNYGGGFYRLAEDATKLLSANDEYPRRWDDIPFFSGFTGHLDEDRSNSFAKNALYDYSKNADDVVRRLNAAANTNDITAKMAYEEPEKLPQSARVQTILEGENYILGKMYYEGKKNTYKMKRRKNNTKYGKKGEWYKSREIEKPGVETLEKNWKEIRAQWWAMPDKTQEEKDAKKAFQTKVEDAWHKYYDAEANLVDRLMEEEYNHVEQRIKNGIPYEPKPSTSERVYNAIKEKVENR